MDEEFARGESNTNPTEITPILKFIFNLHLTQSAVGGTSDFLLSDWGSTTLESCSRKESGK